MPYRSSLKFLSINITDSLRWREHINNLCNSLNKAYLLMKCLKDVISVDMIKTIYFAYFQSRIKYIIMFWMTDSYSQKIFRLQKNGIQLMYGIKRRESCRSVFKIHKILTMTSLYILEVLCYTKKSSEFITYNSQLHNYNTRGKNYFHISACNTACVKRSVINLGIKLLTD
jgi:hypothetical protein